MKQADFARALIDGGPVLGLVAANGSDPMARLAVYRNNLVMTWRGALGDQFPVVRQLVGDEFFAGLADEFCALYPPNHPVMARYGDMFADFIADFAPVGDLPYLADVARLEYQYITTGHAADSIAIDPLAWAGWLQDPERLGVSRLQFQAGLAVQKSPYAIFDIWAAHHRDDVDWAAIAVYRGQSVVIWRQEWRVMIEAIADDWADAITALQAPACLGETMALPFDWQPILAFLLERKLVCGVDDVE